MKWKSDDTYRLVSIYQEYECLWNSNSAEYRLRDARRAAESEIVARMGIDGFEAIELRQKLKNIRTTYKQEVVKNMRAKEKNGGYFTQLKWFKIMDDMMKRVKSGKSTESQQTLIDKIDASEVNESLKSLVKDKPVTDNPVINNPSEQPVIVMLESFPPGQKQQTLEQPTKSQPITKKKKLQHIKETIKELRSLNQTLLLDDEPSPSVNSAFGSYVGTSLDGLTPLQAVLAQNEIHNILMKYRLEAVSKDTNNKEPEDQSFYVYNFDS